MNPRRLPIASRIHLLSRSQSRSQETPPAKGAEQGRLFETLYHPEQRGPVAPVVRELWGVRHAASVEPEPAIAPPTDISAQRRAGPSLNAPLDLFRFMRPTVRRPA